ncbi:MAG: hypothetical protein R6U58_06135 [Bacteroidales bacterium]
MPAHLKWQIIISLILLVNPGVLSSEFNSEGEFLNKKIQYGVYYKIDQGASWGVLMDQRMSNLHYEGPGGILNFGRRAHRPSYISEWSFARLRYNYSKPAHKSTVVENPEAGLRYFYLRKLLTPRSYAVYAGGEVNVFGNFRMAQRLGNSYLHADMIGEIRPRGDLNFSSRFLWRDWYIELSAAASLIGYTVRVPEYGVSFELKEDGGVKTQGFEQQLLMPHNYAHVTTGIFIRESFRGESNPNWFRIGYVWDYYTMRGKHNLNVSNAVQQLVLELYFRVR